MALKYRTRGLRGARARAVRSRSSARDRNSTASSAVFRKVGIAGRLQRQRLDRFDILLQHLLELLDAVRKCALRIVRPPLAGEQPESVLRVRQMIARRGIGAAGLHLGVQGLHQIGEEIGILGMVCVENLRLQIAAFLSAARRGSERERQNMSLANRNIRDSLAKPVRRVRIAK